MAWLLVAQVASQVYAGSKQAKAAAETSIAQNKMVQDYNKKVMYETLQQTTELNLQRAQQREQTTAALYNVGLQGMSARDQITAQAAGTDTIGASVNDAISTVNQKQSQAVGSQQNDYMRAIDQSNIMLEKITTNGRNSLKNAVEDHSSEVMDNALMGAAGTVLGSMAGKYASGTNSTTPGAPITAAQGTPTGAYDYQGFNSDPNAAKNPFGLSFKFQSSNLLGN